VLVTLSKLLAPYIPFMAESMYQNLVRTQDSLAPESVHFCDFPVADETMIDKDNETQMEALLAVVQLGRACRNLSNLKVRQPVSALYVIGARFGEPYAELIEDELNVKRVELVREARAFTTYQLKPQMRTLGPRYGKLLGKIGQYLKTLDGNDVVEAFARGETLSFEIDGVQVSLNQDDVLTQSAQKEGFMAQSDGGVTVALDTNLTPALISEGFARELISKVQAMRKDAGFDVVDRILLTYQASAPVAQAVDTFRAMIEKAVLALSVDDAPASDGAFVKELDLNGEKAVVGIKKA